MCSLDSRSWYSWGKGEKGTVKVTYWRSLVTKDSREKSAQRQDRLSPAWRMSQQRWRGCLPTYGLGRRPGLGHLPTASTSESLGQSEPNADWVAFGGLGTGEGREGNIFGLSVPRQVLYVQNPWKDPEKRHYSVHFTWAQDGSVEAQRLGDLTR